jgi:Carboxypeptidase regulatory-like domain
VPARADARQIRRAFDRSLNDKEIQEERVMLNRAGSIVLLSLFLFMPASAPAQVSRTSGSLAVAASDQSGAAVAGATVTVTNEENGQQRTALTEQDGQLVLSGLAPGTYAVTVSAKSFATARVKGVHLGLGAQSTVSVQMTPQAVNQEVTVTAVEAMIDPGQTAVATSIDTDRIEESPVVSRNYLDFVLLAPGLTSSNQQANANRGVPQADSGFSFAGQRPRSNALYIDGVENNDEFTGATRTELSLELVREFQVVNNGLAAEAGGGSGGSINVITRSGVNTIHGDAFVFFQNGALNARDKFLNEPEKPDTNKFRAGLAFGGPIIRDKTFFYVAGEQETKNDEASSAIDPASAAAFERDSRR